MRKRYRYLMVSLPHRQFTIRIVSKRSMMIDFISIFPPFLSFFPARSPAISKSVGNPTHTREGGWLTALVQKSRERLAHFRHTNLLHHRCCLIENCPPRRRVSGRAVLPLLPPSPVKVDEASYSSSRTKRKLETNTATARARLVEGNGSWKRAGEPSAFERGGNSIGESLSIGCLLTTTLSTPHSLRYLYFRQNKSIVDHAKILPSGILHFKMDTKGRKEMIIRQRNWSRTRFICWGRMVYLLPE